MPNNLIHCPNPLCNDEGWYPDYDRNGEAEQVQCEFCYTNPNSYFNALRHIVQSDKCPACDGAKTVLSNFGGFEDCVDCAGTGIRR